MAYAPKKTRRSNQGSKQEFGATRAPRGPSQVRSGAQPVTEDPEQSYPKQLFGSTRAPRGTHTVGTGKRKGTGKKTGGYKVRNNKYNVGK